MPMTACAISPLTFATARVTPLPPQRSPPSRSSFASNSPVDAPGGHRRVAVRARAQADLDLDRGVAAAVEDLAGVDALDLTHRGTTSVTGVTGRRLFGGSRRRGRRGGARARLRDGGAR